MSKEKIHIFDTTLRDGAQTQGVDFSIDEAITVLDNCKLIIEEYADSYSKNQNIKKESVKRNDRIRIQIKNSGKLLEFAFNRTVNLGKKNLFNELNFIEKIEHNTYCKLIRNRITKRLGGRLSAFISGGSALNPNIGYFFLSLGVQIIQGYGQTEASPLISANPPIKVKVETVGPPIKAVKNSNALWGLQRTLVSNLVVGVTEGFFKELEIIGVGYRGQLKGKELVLNLGFSHDVNYKIPDGITITMEGQNQIKISGCCLEKLYGCS